VETMTVPETDQHAGGASPEPASDFGATLLRVAWLGLGIGWVSQRPWGGAAAHLAVGLAVGLVFGGFEIFLASGATPPPPAADLFVEGINEVLFPVGCALVLFSATAIGKKAVANRSE
jgi:hypothetical protein